MSAILIIRSLVFGAVPATGAFQEPAAQVDSGVTDTIVTDSVDAGATWDFNWSRAVEKHADVFKPLFQTPLIPNLTIMAHSSLPDRISSKIQQILPTIDPALLKGLPTPGFVIRPDNFYDGIRLLVEENRPAANND